MSGVETTSRSGGEEEGWRFDRWVKAHFPTSRFGQLQKLCRTGQFRLDGKRVEASERLAPGQQVRVPPSGRPGPQRRPRPRPARSEPEDAAFIRSLVVYEDERLIALNKPAGLAVQGGSGTTRHVDGLLDALADEGRAAEARAPPRPRHLGADGRRAHGCGRARARLRLPAAQGPQALLGDPAQRARAQPGPDRPAAGKGGAGRAGEDAPPRP